MGGVPVLLALAVVGVDYGYQPDGNGKIDYIVQVSPEHWEQAQEAGEITSVIDPAVRGRVNRIIIRIGDGELPRDAGSPAATQEDDAVASISPAHALTPMPPPSETAANIRNGAGDNAYVPTPDLLADGGPAAELLGARVMRPDPQTQQEGGGFQLPSQQTSGNESANARQREQQWPSESELAAQRSANANRDQRANSETPSSSSDPFGRLSGRASEENASQSGSDARTTRTSEDRVQPPSTDPRRSSEIERPGTQPRGAAAGRDEANWKENPAASRGPSTAYPREEASPAYQRNDPASTSGSTAPPDNDRRTTTPSHGFGAQPMPSSPNSSNGYAAPNRNYVDTPASLQPDHRLAGYDRYGRPVNAAGELIPVADRAPSAEPPQGRGYNSPLYAEIYPDRYAMAGSAAERDRMQAEAARLASERASVPERANVPQYGREREPQAATTAEPPSPSDNESSRKAEQQIAAELAATRAALASADEAKSQSVVSQPVFNFLLLVSLVANAYLILQMSRLLQRYRNMVANMRSASTPVG